MALTFDACGGPGGDRYDVDLIEMLRREKAPATLFLTERWIVEHPEVAKGLASEPLFELQNHGTRHLPCSVTGRGAFGIKGPSSEEEARDEIAGGAHAIARLTGALPRFYRPGTGYFDPACVDVVRASGARPLGFTVAGDAGGSFSPKRIARAVAEAHPGAIVLLHMNQPGRGIAEAVAEALPRLRERGVVLVRLTDAFSSLRKGTTPPKKAPLLDGSAARQSE